MICQNPERSEECLSDQVVVERQCLDKVSETATRLFTKRTYKVTFVFKSRQGVDRFIGGASWIWLKYTITKVYMRPREISSLDRERLSSG